MKVMKNLGILMFAFQPVSKFFFQNFHHTHSKFFKKIPLCTFISSCTFIISFHKFHHACLFHHARLLDTSEYVVYEWPLTSLQRTTKRAAALFILLVPNISSTGEQHFFARETPNYTHINSETVGQLYVHPPGLNRPIETAI